MRLSQADLADLLDVSRATVSEANSEGHKCRGYPVRAWAKFDGSGRVSGYDVHSRVVERSNPAGSGGSDGPPLTEREIAEKEMEWEMEWARQEMERGKKSPEPFNKTYASLLPEGEDYSRTASAGGAAYVMGKAIEEDNSTSHGATMAAGAGVGGVIGICAASESESTSTVTGALVGGLFGGAATYLGMASDFDGSENPALGEGSKPKGLPARSEQSKLPEQTNEDRTRGNQSNRTVAVNGSRT